MQILSLITFYSKNPVQKGKTIEPLGSKVEEEVALQSGIQIPKNGGQWLITFLMIYVLYNL